MNTILLVDDSPTILLSLKTVLGKAGYAVETANDGQQGLDRLSGGLRPQLIISDVNMPRLDGLAFVKALRALPGLRFVPVLMLTTETEQAKRAAAKAAGATGWLVKPVQSPDLLAVLKQVLPAA
jgi:two-component system chemotaxis response regulator CheY